MTILSSEPRFWPEITTARRRRETLLALGDRGAYEEALRRRRAQAWERDPERACAVFCSRGGHRRIDLEVACREILGAASRKLISRIIMAHWKHSDRCSGTASYHGGIRVPASSLLWEGLQWNNDISKRKPGNVRDRALMRLARRLLNEVFGSGRGPRIDVFQGRMTTLVRKGPYGGRLKYDLTITADLFRVPPEDRCGERALRLSPDMRVRGFKNRHLVLERLEPSGWKQLKGRW